MSKDYDFNPEPPIMSGLEDEEQNRKEMGFSILHDEYDAYREDDEDDDYEYEEEDEEEEFPNGKNPCGNDYVDWSALSKEVKLRRKQESFVPETEQEFNSGSKSGADMFSFHEDEYSEEFAIKLASIDKQCSQAKKISLWALGLYFGSYLLCCFGSMLRFGSFGLAIAGLVMGIVGIKKSKKYGTNTDAKVAVGVSLAVICLFLLITVAALAYELLIGAFDLLSLFYSTNNSYTYP